MNDLIEVHSDDPRSVSLLETFIKTTIFPPSFRYFASRTATFCLEHHELTLLALDLDSDSDSERAIGYAHVDRDGDLRWVGFCVVPEQRNTGIGTILMKRVIAFAEKPQCTQKLMLSVDFSNVAAIRFYERHGFRAIEADRIGLKPHPSALYMCRQPSDCSVVKVPVSIGEALDKLSILKIKLQNISDEKKLEFIRAEHDALQAVPAVKHSLKTTRFYFDELLHVNKMIWDDQDLFREMTVNNNNSRSELCEKIIADNDARFRIKMKINTQGKSKHREQKGYATRTVAVLTHRGLGDNITAVGMVRYLAARYDRVLVACKVRNMINVKQLYEDDPSIIVIGTKTPEQFKKRARKRCLSDLTFVKVGRHTGTNSNNDILPFNFYQDAKIPLSVFWDYFHVPTTPGGERLYDIVRRTGRKYTFVHNSCSTGPVFSIKTQQIREITKAMLIIDPCTNHYPRDHRDHDLAQRFVGRKHPLVNYIPTMIHADAIVLCTSSFFCLALHLNIHTEERFFVSGKDYRYLWSPRFQSERKKQSKPFRWLSVLGKNKRR